MNILKTQPPDCRTLWIGDIEAWMDEGYIQNLFQGLASVQSVKIIRDRVTGLPDGYGFVEFSAPDIAKKVLNTLNGSLIPGSSKQFSFKRFQNFQEFLLLCCRSLMMSAFRTFKLNWAAHNLNTTSSQQQQSIVQTPAPYVTAPAVPQEYTLYANDLDLYANDTILFQAFKKKYANTISAKVVLDPVTKTSKCYGFVKFSSYDESQRALKEMNGQYVLTKPIRLSSANLSQSSNDVNTYNYLISQEAQRNASANGMSGYEQLYYNLPPPTLPFYLDQINPNATLDQFNKNPGGVRPQLQQQQYYQPPQQYHQFQNQSQSSLRNPKLDYFDPNQQYSYQYHQPPPPHFYQQQPYQQQPYQQQQQHPPPPMMKPVLKTVSAAKRLFSEDEITKMNEEYARDHQENYSLIY